jgi:hypothetical protein
MTTLATGHLTSVFEDPQGSVVAVDSGDDGLLVVADAGDFDETGGSVLVDGATLAYTAVEEADPTAEYDDPAGLVLAAPTGTPVPAGTPVLALSEGEPTIALLAEVWPDGQDVDAGVGDPIHAEVDHGQADRLAGDWPAGGWACTIQRDDEEDPWRLVHVSGKVPLISGDYIDAATLPVPPLTDGDPPATSPTPTAIGLLRQVIVKWDAVSNADPVTYHVHVAATDAAAPDSSTFHHATSGTLTSASTLPDGTGLAYGATYYAAVWVGDGDGMAPAPSAWVPFELDPAGTEDIAVGAITTVHLQSQLVIADEVATAASGRRAGMSAGRGIFAEDSATEQTVSFASPDGSPNYLDGGLISRGFTAVDLASFRAVVELAQGSTTYLRSATTPPATSPTVAQSVEYAAVTGEPAWGYGAALIGSDFHRVQNLFWDTNIQSFDSSGASLGFATIPPGFAGRGVAAVGTSRYLLGIKESDSKFYIRRYNSTWTTLLDEWLLFAGSTGLNASRNPALGTDGTDLLMAVVIGGDLLLRRYDATTGAILGSDVNTGTFSDSHFAAVMYGSFDFGATRWVVITRDRAGGDLVRVFNTAGVRQSAEEWTLASLTAGGALWDGSRFRVFARGAERLWRYSDDTWTTAADSTRRVANTWTESGGGQTMLGPRATFTAKKRWRTTVTIPDIPSGSDGAKVYLNKGASDPGPTGSWLQSTTAVRTVTLPTPVWSGTSAPTTSTYPGGTPAILRSDKIASNGDPMVNLLGDGSGQAGPSRWNSDGRVIGRGRWNTTTTPNVSNNTFTTRTGWTETDATNYPAVGVTHSAGVFTVTEAGLYRVTATVTFASGANGRRVFRFLVDGASAATSEPPVGSGTLGRVGQTITTDVYLPAGGTVEVQGLQASGGALAWLSEVAGQNEFCIYRIGT